jgi:alpha-methylacyl-CoA racemase
MEEAPLHPHNVARGGFVELDGVTQPGPAPRFSRTGLDAPTPPRPPGDVDLREVLAAWGLAAGDVEAARAAGVLVPSR